MFAALGDGTRLNLLSRLSLGPPLSISRLSDGSSLTRQAVTKHLRVLERAGLVRCIRHGRERRFALRPDALDQARRELEAIAHQWDEALYRLRAHVERP